MPHFCAPTCQSKEPTICDSTAHSPISILNDDILLNIFYLYQLGLQDTDVYKGMELVLGEFTEIWKRQRWWYKLAHVSQLWRHIILASPSKLDLHLICTHGVPVGDMLTHSPSLPLIILYTCEVTTKDEEATILLALSQHDRVRRIALQMPALNLEKLIQAMDREYPILERLYINRLTEGSDAMLPETFRMPNLRQISLSDIVGPKRYPLLPCTGDLVCLWLDDIPKSVHLSPRDIHIQLSSMPQLEILGIELENTPDNNVVGPLMTPVTLPNLGVFSFLGGSTPLESLLSVTSVPVLKLLCITFYHPLDFHAPHLLKFIQSSKFLTFKTFELGVSGDQVVLSSDLHPELDESLSWYCGEIEGGNLGQQVVSAVQMLSMLSPMLSAVEKLTFSYTTEDRPAELHGIDRIQLRELLRPFSGVKTLHVQNELVRDISRSLCSEDGEPPVEILPNLEELSYSGSNVGDIFTRFINERQTVGHTVTVRLA